MAIQQVGFGSFSPIRATVYALVSAGVIGVGAHVNDQSNEKLHETLKAEQELNEKQAKQIASLEKRFEDQETQAKAMSDTVSALRHVVENKISLDQIPRVEDKVKRLVVRVRHLKVVKDTRYESMTETGTGSGVIIIDGDKRYIGTNAHNLENPSKNETYEVSLYNGTNFEKPQKFDAKIAVLPNGKLAYFRERDFGLLEVPKDVKLPVDEGIVFRDLDKDKLEQGEPVLVVGNQAGEKDSVTFGIISNLDRKMVLEKVELENRYIQTDATSNGGVSGGGMFDLKGRFIGMPNFKHAEAEGIGYSISGENIKELLKSCGVSYKVK